MEGKTLADIGREMEAYREAGMAGCKFKVGGPDAGRGCPGASRSRDKQSGPDFILAVDAAVAGRWPDAVRFARLVEPLAIRWFEEPCHWQDDAAMMARVRQATRIPADRRPVGRSPVRACDAWSRPAPSISSTSTLRRAAESPSGAAQQRYAGRPGCRWRTTRSRRSPST